MVATALQDELRVPKRIKLRGLVVQKCKEAGRPVKHCVLQTEPACARDCPTQGRTKEVSYLRCRMKIQDSQQDWAAAAKDAGRYFSGIGKGAEEYGRRGNAKTYADVAHVTRRGCCLESRQHKSEGVATAAKSKSGDSSRGIWDGNGRESGSPCP